MKITMEIPTERIKANAATIALLGGETLPMNFGSIVDSAQEIDITDDLQKVDEPNMLMTAIATIAAGKIIKDKC